MRSTASDSSALIFDAIRRGAAIGHSIASGKGRYQWPCETPAGETSSAWEISSHWRLLMKLKQWTGGAVLGLADSSHPIDLIPLHWRGRVLSSCHHQCCGGKSSGWLHYPALSGSNLIPIRPVTWDIVWEKGDRVSVPLSSFYPVLCRWFSTCRYRFKNLEIFLPVASMFDSVRAEFRLNPIIISCDKK